MGFGSLFCSGYLIVFNPIYLVLGLSSFVGFCSGILLGSLSDLITRSMFIFSRLLVIIRFFIRDSVLSDTWFFIWFIWVRNLMWYLYLYSRSW
nr:MAG TPA: hypothetical protein [Caudoviricetes sp.]